MTAQRHLLMTADAVGGVWTYALNLARGLAPLGYRTTLALLGPDASGAQRAAARRVPGMTLLETGLPLDWLAGNAGDVRMAGGALADLAARCGADLVQLNQPALAAEADFPVPVIAMAHSCVATWWQACRQGPLPPDLAWQADLTAQGLRRADIAVCPSAGLADALVAAYGIARPLVVHNGALPLPLRPAAPHDFVFTAGRLWDDGKDLATLDRVAERLPVPVKAAGPLEGPNGQRFAPRHLHAIGPTDARGLGDCLSARPVFASTARYEPFGLAVLEAAQAGCPLVLSDIPTFRELWEGAALFAPPGDDAAFAAVIDGLMHDLTARHELGRRAQAHAARYTVDAMAQSMAGLFTDIALRRRAA